jgi:hypothetical protein
MVTVSVALTLDATRKEVSLTESEVRVTTVPEAEAETPIAWRSVSALTALAMEEAMLVRESPPWTV